MPEPDGPPHDLPRLIEVLDRHGVEYLVVGGAAAFAYGVERPTEDAGCVVRRARANLDRLAAALREMHARLRVGGMTDAEARMLPVQIDSATLDMAGRSTWMTDAGPFDVLPGLEAPDGRLMPLSRQCWRERVARSIVGTGTAQVPLAPGAGPTTTLRCASEQLARVCFSSSEGAETRGSKRRSRWPGCRGSGVGSSPWLTAALPSSCSRSPTTVPRSEPCAPRMATNRPERAPSHSSGFYGWSAGASQAAETCVRSLRSGASGPVRG